jgi:predicted nucleic-acid-binding protein
MDKTENQRLRKAILEVINTQIRDNDPPETKQTLIRLHEQGFSEEAALRLIGYVVATEVFAVLEENRQYDQEKYIAALNNLPRLPWENGA